MKIVPIIILLSLIQLSTTAQQKITRKDIAVSSEIGILNGKSQVNIQVLGMAGIQKKKYSLSLGSGFDYYGYRTIPVFVEGKRFLGEGNRKIFIYLRSGLNIAWVLSEQQRVIYTSTGKEFSKFSNGLYADAGIGYTLYNTKGRGIFLGLGACMKNLSENYNDYVWNGASSTLTNHDVKYSFNNIQLRIGYTF
jgi:hypothetical protein